jgi:putative membrane protein
MDGLLVGSGDGHWPWLAPLWLLVWIVVLFTLIRFCWWGPRRRWRRDLSPDERARRILAERYASGEIDAAEYRSRLDGLSH